MAIMTSTIRLCFGMARDDQLPISKTLAKVNPRLHTPVWSCVAIGPQSAVPFVQFAGAGIIAVAATAMIYLSYVLGNLAVMRARTRGWPKVDAPFKLGRWGKVLNALGILWGARLNSSSSMMDRGGPSQRDRQGHRFRKAICAGTMGPIEAPSSCRDRLIGLASARIARVLKPDSRGTR
jgi:hypothetical protein